jgi:hypothetical protein
MEPTPTPPWSLDCVRGSIVIIRYGFSDWLDNSINIIVRHRGGGDCFGGEYSAATVSALPHAVDGGRV